ncbi:methyl-accepting chemotaxis sensory transducer [Malonomonas rubra DSM 5091]|uniref:Methyl-accepting chemotaxis sensory transducer n=1 Tax=Malonomonas rubra DSM 5091 TaxID=1122189 RepID=A0A1M6JF02_MALRU|nr:methyl-accepting chemotaxis protein [Malonomonas rubra]SHJ45254.1 methyl-accepting chemotaxis sensory transducer [Malonomonas rubra DSM 5091]
MKNLSLRTKLVAGGVLLPAMLLCALFISFAVHEKNRVLEDYVGKSRILATTVESTRMEEELKWETGMFNVSMLKEWGNNGELNKVLAAVPVVTAWNSAMRKAEEGGYTFKVPKFNPRNSSNTPDALESEILKKMKRERLDEYHVIDKEGNNVHYFRAVYLTESCLYCHGDPAKSEEYWGNSRGVDPTGAQMENWKVGEMHGAFEIIHSLDAADAALASSLGWASGLFIVLLILVGVAISWFATRAVVNPVRESMEMIEGLERGELDRRIRTNRQDELGRLATAMNGFADNLKDEVLEAFNRLAAGDFTFQAKGLISAPLRKACLGLTEVMHTVQCAGEQITTGSQQVAEQGADLANGATKQAAALEEIAASMTEMNEQTRNNAENAAEVNKISNVAKSAADEGSRQMQGMISAMEEINASAQDISKIIKVIDEIAFQTNLLALNAAVEAARAGQHGKGFAVVAEEVRNLASRSAKAAQETSTLIAGSVEKADNGAQIANQTAESLARIVENVTKVSDLVEEIAAASHEQSMGISQVNEGLQQLDDVNQNTTSTAEESASIAEELSAQTADMHRMLQQFKLANMAAPAQPLPRPPVSSPASRAPKPSAPPTNSATGGWGDIESTQQIKLDDDDFGRY